MYESRIQIRRKSNAADETVWLIGQPRACKMPARQKYQLTMKEV